MQLSYSVKMMGTTTDTVADSDTPHQYIKEVYHFLTVYKNRFSTNDGDSELVTTNYSAGIAPIIVRPGLFELIESSKAHSLLQSSNLDIVIGPLVQSWRIGFEDTKVSDKENIQKAIALANPEYITLNATEKSVLLNRRGMKIDLDVLTKGYIADKTMDYLETKNVSSAMINPGDNILVYNDNPKHENGIWHIGIQHPQKQRGNNLGILTLRDKSVVTSGVYERHLQVSDKDYHHIFGQHMGCSIEIGMASLTVASDLSVNCGIWTTRLFGPPIKQAFEITQSTPNIEGIIITKDSRFAVTNGLKQDFQLLYP